MQNQHVLTNYSEEIERWAYQDMLQLAHNFHRLNRAKEQYERATNFIMEKEIDVPRFESLRASIRQLRIYMALEKQDQEKITFFPVLEVLTSNEEKHFFKLYPIYGGRTISGASEIVPELFKDIICGNWDTIDLNLVDDLFVATITTEGGFEVFKRVKFFEISSGIITNVIQKLPEITGITMYSGIDMNKFPNKNQISFTPVLGFRYDEPEEEIDLNFGLKTIIEFTKGEVFIEYSRPCPPTC